LILLPICVLHIPAVSTRRSAGVKEFRKLRMTVRGTWVTAKL